MCKLDDGYDVIFFSVISLKSALRNWMRLFVSSLFLFLFLYINLVCWACAKCNNLHWMLMLMLIKRCTQSAKWIIFSIKLIHENMTWLIYALTKINWLLLLFFYKQNFIRNRIYKFIFYLISSIYIYKCEQLCKFPSCIKLIWLIH